MSEAQPLDSRTRRRILTILRIIQQAATPLGSQRIAEALTMQGLEIGERTVRNYLFAADQHGWTENLGRRGRKLTQRGVQELRSSELTAKLGMAASRIDTLVHECDFSLRYLNGKVVANICTVDESDAAAACAIMMPVFSARLGVGERISVGRPGDRFGSFEVPAGRVAFITVCNVTLSSVLTRAGIPVTHRLGGLVRIMEGRPRQFAEVIRYDAATLSPLELMVRAQMTDVHRAAISHEGIVCAGLREMPASAVGEIQDLLGDMRKAGLGATLFMGRPGIPIFDVPVGPERVGVLLNSGLNPVAAAVEAGIPVTCSAMGALVEFDELEHHSKLEEAAASFRR